VLVRGAGLAGRVRSLVAGESLLVPAVAPPSVAPPTVAAPSVVPPSVVPPSVVPPSVVPPSVAPPTVAPPSVAPPSPAPRPATTVRPSLSAASPASTRPTARVAAPAPSSAAPAARASAPAEPSSPEPADTTPRRDSDALLQAADRARRAGHFAEAAELLQQVAGSDDDPQRAALAAFTLGRLYTGPFARPAQAAQAFERALTLGLPQALMEDTLLRQAEAYQAAGDLVAARAVATRYLTRFPDGRDRQRMLHWRDPATPQP
jgi:hypothetical protein